MIWMWQLYAHSKMRFQHSKVERQRSLMHVNSYSNTHVDGFLNALSLLFSGAIVIVSHDRWFLDRIATDIIAFEKAGVYF